MRVYTVSFKAVAVSAAQDLFELLTPSDLCAVIIGLQLSQEDLDASELLQVDLLRVTGAPTSGSAGSTPTPRPIDAGDAASTCTVEANNTTQLSGGTSVDLATDYWQVLSNFLYKPVPEERIIISPSTRLVVELPVAPSASTNMSGTLTFGEIGG